MLNNKFSWIPFVVPFVVFCFSIIGIMNSGDGSNYAQTKSLAEDGTFYIDNYQDYTYNTDYSISPTTKRIVPDREFGLSLLGVPFYKLGKSLGFLSQLPYLGQHENIYPESIIQMWTYMSVPFFVSFCLSLSLQFLLSRHHSFWSVSATIFSICFGSLMWKYSTSFIRQPVTAISLFTAVIFFVEYLSSGRKNNNLIFFVGIFLGIAAITDYFTWSSALLSFIFLLFSDQKKSWFKFLLGFVPFLLSAIIYNQIIFGKPITSPHSYEGKPEYSYMLSFQNNFKTNPLYGPWLNLFSYGPIPKEALSWVFAHPQIADTIGANWATVWSYKGIIIQSPILIFAILGWFGVAKDSHNKNKKTIFLFFLALFLLNYLPMSLFTQFWSPNIFDSRHFLNVVPFTLFGLVYFLKHKHNVFVNGLVILSLVVSVYFAFGSTISNFGPSLSTEHRFDIASFFDGGISLTNLTNGLLNSFPNVYNWYLILPFSFLGYFLIAKPLTDLIIFFTKK